MTGKKQRVMVLGATGAIGQATARMLVACGYDVVCAIRAKSGVGGAWSSDNVSVQIPGAEIRVCDVTDPISLRMNAFRNEPFDVLVSCLASRTGVSADAWLIDYQAHVDALAIAQGAGVSQMVLLSAICVQKPKLAFQKAKLAFEHHLINSGVKYSIVRPTAFFKSLSGQIDRVRQGKSFLIFGDGRLTACKPISDRDLALFITDCLENEACMNRILPIGGPGDALTPRAQGELLFDVLGKEPRFRQAPPEMLKVVAGVLSPLGRIFPPLAAKAELARIGHYYATESMLVWDDAAGAYSSDQTPSTGVETLRDYYAAVVAGSQTVERGDHAAF